MIFDHTFSHAIHALQHGQDEIREAFRLCASGLTELVDFSVYIVSCGREQEQIA